MPTRAGEFTSSEADEDPFRLYRAASLDYSRHSGLSESALGRLQGPARHFLTWLEQDGTSIEIGEPYEYDRQMCKLRNEIKRLFRRFKGFRRIFSRFENLDALFLGFIHFALIYDAVR